MSQRIVTSWLNTNIPGAYVNTQVISNASGLATSGVVLIMGEADGGPDYSITKLANNFFGPSASTTVKSIYTSGQIVDAFDALAAPSNDPDIVGTASSIYIIKTNKGTKASALVPAHSSSYGTMSAINWGIGGNLNSFTVTSLDSETPPSVTGTTIPSYVGLSGAAFTVRINGGADIVITPGGSITDRPSLLTSLNAAFATASANLSATAGVAINTIAVTWSATSGSASPVADAAAYSKGWGKSFELVDSTPGDLAALGLLVGLYSSSQEPAVEVQVVNASAGVNEILNVLPSVAFTIGYQGTTATMTISSTTLTTNVTGGSGANLSITLSQYPTVNQLVGFINSQTGYVATCAPSAVQLPPSSLDHVTAIGICSNSTFQPGRVKNAVFAFEQQLGTSTAVTFAAIAVQGLPDPGALTYLSGGARGPTLAADIVNCIAQMAGIQVNIIVPLFSQNATADIAAGNTDPGSTYTINAINELLKSHCIQYSTPTLKRNRMAILSYNDTYANCKAEAQSLATYRCSMTCQQITDVNSQGVNVLFLPWYASCVAAGMQAGGFYKSIVNHLANVVSFTDPVGYDSGDPDDVSDALSAGLLVLTQTNGGIPWVSDQTTYGLDTNFVYNSIQAVYLSDILSLDLAQSFQTAIVGKSVADVSAGSALSFLQQRFDFYKKAKIVTSSNSAPLGYSDASVVISAPSMYVNVNALLSTSIYFVAINLDLSPVQQSASG
jgi:hypothetical protein